jgi:hypothetical protein
MVLVIPLEALECGRSVTHDRSDPAISASETTPGARDSRSQLLNQHSASGEFQPVTVLICGRLKS